MGEMGKGEMGTAHAGKPPSLPRELRTPLVSVEIECFYLKIKNFKTCGGKITYARK
jgi:hypothetical protein